MLRIKDLAAVILVVGIVTNWAEANLLHRIRRQSDDGKGEIIDNIFNIPITAIRQTAAAAQSFYPDNGGSIDTVFNIPVATLEAVGNLVKTRNSVAQRRPNDSSDDIKKRRKERKQRKDRLHAQRQGQRLQHNDPLGVNALTDLLVGNHGLFSGHGVWGGHQKFFGDHFSGNWGSQLISHFCGHGSSHGDGDGGDDDGGHDSVGDVPVDSGIASSDGGNNNGYEVTEIIDEDRSGWGGWLNFGNFFGGSSGQNPNKISSRPDRRRGRYDERDAPLENKIAPKYDRTNNRRSQDYRPLENKIAPKYDRRSQGNRPLENKIAPKNERRYYQGNYADPPLEDRVAPRREGRDRFVFEHRSF